MRAIVLALLLSGCGARIPAHATIISDAKPRDGCKLVDKVGTVEQHGVWWCAPDGSKTVKSK